jgi:HAMP domain-containing protein
MEVNFVDKNGREVPLAEGSKLAKVLGFDAALSALRTASAFAPEDALGALVALREGGIAVRMHYERETGKWVVGVVQGPRTLEVELVPYVGSLGDTKWKAVVKLPCEWSPGLSTLVDAIDIVEERLKGEIQALRAEIERLKTQLSEGRPEARAPEPPIDAASARRIARALRELADALEDAFEELEEEELEEEEEEW